MISTMFLYTLAFLLVLIQPLLGIISLFILTFASYKINKYCIFIFIMMLLNIISINYYHNIEGEVSIIVQDNLTYEDDYVSFETTYKRDKYTVTIFGAEKSSIKYGDVLYLYDYDVKDITNKYNNNSSFDYEQYMLGNKITKSITINSYESTTSMTSVIYRFKNIRLSNIEENKKTLENYEYVNALVYGENQFDEEQYEEFATLNIVHALTISGSHIILIIAFIKISLSILNISSAKINKLLLIILPCYCILAGSSIPVLRATLLELGVIIYANKYNRLEMTQLIFIAFIVLNPYCIYLVSFQLTFVIGFFLFYIDKLVTSKNLIIASLQTSTWLSLLILPITLNLNYQINFLSPIANLILVPIISFVLLPLSFLIELLPFLNFITIPLLNFGVIIFESLSSFFSLFTITTGHIGLLYSIGLIFCIFMYAETKNNMYVYTTCGFILFLPINFNILGSVTYIDVGQGDACLIELPFNQGEILIDTGSAKAESEVIDFLLYSGIRTVDIMFLSHSHEDHIGNAQKIYDTFRVKDIYGPVSNTKNEHVVELQAGDVINFKNYTFNILYPYEPNENPNSESLVISVNFGIHDYLFTGDIEATDESVVTENSDINSNVLKVPHHGSPSSSSEEFIKAVSPNYCIVSVGENNQYNHPSPNVIKLLEQNCDVLQTKDVGQVTRYFITPRSITF